MLSAIPSPHDDRVLIDFRTSDDAGVYRWEGGPALVQTVDFFTPIVDDPYTYGQIAAAVGKDRASVANYLRLLKLPDKVRDDVASGTLSMGHARALLALPTEADQLRAARDVVEQHLSVRDTETLVKRMTDGLPPKAPAAAKPTDVHTRAAEERLRLALGTRVRIVRKGKAGRIEIDFNSEDELIRIYEQLTDR